MEEDLLLRFLNDESIKCKESVSISNDINKLLQHSDSVPSKPCSSKNDVYDINSMYKPGQVKKIDIVSKGFSVDKFKTLLRNRMIEEFKSYENYERPYISVGELISCMRQSYFFRKKYAVDYNKKFNFAYLYLFQKRSQTVHSIIQDIYRFDKVEYSIISKKYRIKGKCDGVLDNFLYDIKVVDPDKFKGKIEPDHYFQALAYSYILNTEYSCNIDTITIVYVIGTMRDIFPIDIKVDMAKGENLLSKSSVLWSCLESNKIPDEKFCKKSDCKWCAYDKYCKTTLPEKESEGDKFRPDFLL